MRNWPRSPREIETREFADEFREDVLSQIGSVVRLGAESPAPIQEQRREEVDEASPGTWLLGGGVLVQSCCNSVRGVEITGHPGHTLSGFRSESIALKLGKSAVCLQFESLGVANLSGVGVRGLPPAYGLNASLGLGSRPEPQRGDSQ
jgi:hypothetical protein